MLVTSLATCTRWACGGIPSTIAPPSTYYRSTKYFRTPHHAALAPQTPLSEDLLASWSLPSAPRHRLTVGELMAQQAALGRRVGLLLDLSNHDCLYEQDIPPDVQYTHVQVSRDIVANRYYAGQGSAALIPGRGGVAARVGRNALSMTCRTSHRSSPYWPV